MLCEFPGADPKLYRRLKIDNCHGALLKFVPQPPHQFVGLNLSPAHQRRNRVRNDRPSAT
jgi:hypothetical protein